MTYICTALGAYRRTNKMNRKFKDHENCIVEFVLIEGTIYLIIKRQFFLVWVASHPKIAFSVHLVMVLNQIWCIWNCVNCQLTAIRYSRVYPCDCDISLLMKKVWVCEMLEHLWHNDPLCKDTYYAHLYAYICWLLSVVTNETIYIRSKAESILSYLRANIMKPACESVVRSPNPTLFSHTNISNQSFAQENRTSSIWKIVFVIICIKSCQPHIEESCFVAWE